MKPKFRNLLRNALPALIIIPAMTQMAQALIITPDGAGNVFVTSLNSGPNSILANGSILLFPPPYVVNVAAGTNLSGDAVQIDTVKVTVAGYTVTNNGTLTSTRDAINSTVSTTIINSSLKLITGGAVAGSNGIEVLGGAATSITNAGTISSFDNAISITSNIATITNNAGGIISATGAAGNGIKGLGNLTVTNSGTIQATNASVLSDGIEALDNANVTNFGTISAVGGSGIIVGNDTAALNTTVDIANYGSITGANGASVGNNVTLHNLTSFVLLTPTAGGVITGAATGISGGNNVNVLNENLSTISGTTGNGVKLLDAGTITNNLGGSISSVNEDAVGLNFGTVTNHGTLTGGAGAGDNGIEVVGGGVTNITNTGGISGFQGITIGGVAVNSVTNSGTITGTGGVAITTGGGIDTVTNSGTITGIGAINTGAGADIVNLNLGSIINGSIDGGLGSDTLTFTGGKTFPSGTSNVVHGNVTMETINKNGSGTAFIGTTGDPLFTVLAETINLNSGGLYINGNLDGVLAAQTTILHNGAGLGGTGTWDANITLGAIGAGISAGQTPINIDDAVDPVNALGKLTITGDVTHTAGSFIRFDVAPQTPIINGVNSDLIVQTGLANSYDVNGAAYRISPTNINKAINNGTYTIVDSGVAIANFNPLATVGVQFNANVVDTGPFFATQGGSNNLNTVLVNNFTVLGLADGGTNLVFTIDHNFAGLPGLTSNESALGGAIDQSVGSSDPIVQDFIAALDYSDLSTVQEALASLSPERYLSQGIALVNSNYRLHRMTQEHLAAVRGSSTTTTYSSGGSKGVMATQTTGSGTGNGNVWGAYSHDWQDYSADNSRHDFDGDTDAFTAGFDWRVGSNLVLGVVLDGSRSNYDGTGSSSDVDSFRGAIYGTWGESMGVYSDFLAGYGTHDMDLSRSFGGILSGFSGHGSSDATSFQALWTVGYTMGNDCIKHGPFAGLEYQNVSVDSFSESGNSLLPLSVGGYDVDSFRLLIGYRVNGSIGNFRPYASAAYAHEFEDSGVRATASFDGHPFSVRGDDQGSAILLTAGTAYSLTESLSLDLGYRGELAVENNGIDSHGGSIGLNYSF